MTKPSWVSVVDDDATVRDTVTGWLARAGCYRLRSAHALAEDAVAAMPEAPPDIVILDVRMGRMDGLECLDRLRPLLLSTAIILHTAYGDADVLHHALTDGANGFVQKDGQAASLLRALADATPTGFYLRCGEMFPLHAASADLVSRRLRITGRELEFLRLLAADYGNKDIAHELHLGRQYVDNRLPRLYRKLGVHTAAGAVARALQLGLIQLPGQRADG
jgi:DNA-binding NarL/FixJ family response regulator